MHPTCKLFGMGLMCAHSFSLVSSALIADLYLVDSPWSPLARGALTRPVGSSSSKRMDSDPGYKGRGLDKPDDATRLITERVEELANKKGISMAQVALAWSLAQEGISAPIIGSTSLDHLEDLISEFWDDG